MHLGSVLFLLLLRQLCQCRKTQQANNHRVFGIDIHWHPWGKNIYVRGQAVFDFNKLKIERGKHFTLLSPPPCLWTQCIICFDKCVCDHVALFAQLIVHVEHCALFAQDGG